MAINWQHPLQTMLIYDTDWNKTFSILWQLSYSSKSLRATVGIRKFAEENDLVAVCDKFESLLEGMPTLEMDVEIGMHYISLHATAQYMKGIAFLYERKGETAMDAAFCLMDISKWKPFTSMDINSLPASRVSLPKKTINFPAFDWCEDDIGQELTALYSDSERVHSPTMMKLSKAFNHTSLTLIFHMSETEIKHRLKEITLSEDIVNVPGDTSDDDGVGKGDGTLTNRPPDLGGPISIEVSLPPPSHAGVQHGNKELQNNPTIYQHESRVVDVAAIVASAVVEPPPAPTRQNKARKRLFKDKKTFPELNCDEDFDAMKEDYARKFLRRWPQGQTELPNVWQMTEMKSALNEVLTPMQATIKKSVETMVEALNNEKKNKPSPLPTVTFTEPTPMDNPNEIHDIVTGNPQNDGGSHDGGDGNVTLPIGIGFSSRRYKKLREPKVNKKQVCKFKNIHLSKEDIKTYGMDPSNSDSVLVFLRHRFGFRSTCSFHSIAPPEVWNPLLATTLMQQLLDLANRGYISLIPNGSDFIIMAAT